MSLIPDREPHCRGRLSCLADADGLTHFSYSHISTEIIDDDAFNAFLDQVLATGNAPVEPTSAAEAGQLGACLEAIRHLLNAVGWYHIRRGVEFGDREAAWIAGKLRLLRNRPTDANLEALIARKDYAPSALALLWQAARDTGWLDEWVEVAGRYFVGIRRVRVRQDKKWNEIGTGPMDWVDALRGQREALEQIAAQAIKLLKKEHKLEDFLRPFRELADNPTCRRFRSILLRDDGADVRPVRDMVADAIYRLGFVSGRPITWVDMLRIAADRDAIRQIAKYVQQTYRHATQSPGPHTQPEFDEFIDTACRVYRELTGSDVTYSSDWAPREPGARIARRGPALDFICAALRLIDPTAAESQARAQIERYRRKFLCC